MNCDSFLSSLNISPFHRNVKELRCRYWYLNGHETGKHFLLLHRWKLWLTRYLEWLWICNVTWDNQYCNYCEKSNQSLSDHLETVSKNIFSFEGFQVNGFVILQTISLKMVRTKTILNNLTIELLIRLHIFYTCSS